MATIASASDRKRERERKSDHLTCTSRWDWWDTSVRGNSERDRRPTGWRWPNNSRAMFPSRMPSRWVPLVFLSCSGQFDRSTIELERSIKRRNGRQSVDEGGTGASSRRRIRGRDAPDTPFLNVETSNLKRHPCISIIGEINTWSTSVFGRRLRNAAIRRSTPMRLRSFNASSV